MHSATLAIVPALADVTIAVNVSVRQLVDARFHHVVAEAIDAEDTTIVEAVVNLGRVAVSDAEFSRSDDEHCGSQCSAASQWHQFVHHVDTKVCALHGHEDIADRLRGFVPVRVTHHLL